MSGTRRRSGRHTTPQFFRDGHEVREVAKLHTIRHRRESFSRKLATSTASTPVTCELPFTSVGEAVVTHLGAIGIRARLRALERAAFLNQWKATNLHQSQSSSFGNAVTRIERHMVSGADFAFGSYPEIDDLFQQQMREPDRAKRETLVHAIQRIAYERVMFAPIWQAAQLNGVRATL
jgi:ABC-type transport system substrate-binding protein